MTKKMVKESKKKIPKNKDSQLEIDELQTVKEELATEKDKFLRLFADFENYKKRTSKERIELFSTANQELMLVLLPILDDFERGMSEISKSDDTSHLEGINLIYTKFLSTLKQKGLQEVEINVGDDFDVDFQEAITQIPAPTEELIGKVLDVTEKGYKLGEKVIRYAKVVIGK